MEKEENVTLSDKMFEVEYFEPDRFNPSIVGGKVFKWKDVKEFIKKLKDPTGIDVIVVDGIIYISTERIDKEAGDKLI